MIEEMLDQWEREFRTAALVDEMTIFRDHLRRLGLPDSPYLMLEGTIQIVRRCASYAAVDQRVEGFRDFLAMQTYDPAQSTESRYAYSFDIFGKAFGRVLIKAYDGTLDLADIYGSPWNEHELVGFRYLWVSHPDWSPLLPGEASEIDDAITSDLRFDYTDEEVDFWCDDSLDESYVGVSIWDVVFCDPDDPSGAIGAC